MKKVLMFILLSFGVARTFCQAPAELPLGSTNKFFSYLTNKIGYLYAVTGYDLNGTRYYFRFEEKNFSWKTDGDPQEVLRQMIARVLPGLFEIKGDESEFEAAHFFIGWTACDTAKFDNVRLLGDVQLFMMTKDDQGKLKIPDYAFDVHWGLKDGWGYPIFIPNVQRVRASEQSGDGSLYGLEDTTNTTSLEFTIFDEQPGVLVVQPWVVTRGVKGKVSVITKNTNGSLEEHLYHFDTGQQYKALKNEVRGTKVTITAWPDPERDQILYHATSMAGPWYKLVTVKCTSLDPFSLIDFSGNAGFYKLVPK